MATEDVFGTYIIPAVIAGGVAIIGVILQSRKETKNYERETMDRAREASAAMSVAAKDYISTLVGIEEERRASATTSDMQTNAMLLFAPGNAPKQKSDYMFLGKLGDSFHSDKRKELEKARHAAHANLTLAIANLLTEAPGVYLHKQFGELRAVISVAEDINSRYANSEPQNADEELAILNETVMQLGICFNGVDPWLIQQSNHLRKLGSSFAYKNVLARWQKYEPLKAEWNKGLI